MLIAPLLAAAATHVALTFASDLPLPRRALRTAVSEAAEIWSPYRVVVDETLPCASAPDEAIVLRVATGRSRSAAHIGPLGSIEFDEDGVPDRVLTVFLDLLLRFVAKVQIWHVGEDRWPASLRDFLVGRALGRVLAHEIGHYLLGSREHSAMGLMRAVHHSDELFDNPRTGFVLAPSDARRLTAGGGPARTAGGQ